VQFTVRNTENLVGRSPNASVPFNARVAWRRGSGSPAGSRGNDWTGRDEPSTDPGSVDGVPDGIVCG
jgi:hypothetical protein